MTGLDTNILARYYIEDEADDESVKQRELARRIIEAGKPLMVWVMRGYYEFERQQIVQVMQHLMSLTHLDIEDRDAVEYALASYLAGLDFADALHHACYRTCKSMLTFDDRKFARRAKRLALVPNVSVPK
jgi:predicted nucleic-acid-binding protein